MSKHASNYNEQFTSKEMFIMEKEEKRTTLQIVADFLASHESKQFKVTGDEKCRALVIEKI